MPLSTTKYVAPGAYIGQLLTPEPSTPSGARIPCYVAKGNRLALGRNSAVRRSYVYDETLVFSVAAPYRATLANASDGDQTNARLYKTDGTEVRLDRWRFVLSGPDYLIVEIADETYDPTATYHIDYQSTDRDVNDAIPFDEIREFITVGNFEDQSDYEEHVNFYNRCTISAPVGTGITNTTTDFQAPQFVGAGAVTCGLSPGATYTGRYNRYYKVTVSGLVPGVSCNLTWTSVRASGGNLLTDGPSGPLHTTGTGTVVAFAKVASPLTVVLELGVSLVFTWAGADPVDGDYWTLNARGAAIVEKDLRYDNDNVFTSLDAPFPDPGNAGLGSLALSGDAEYTGDYNSRIYLEVRAIAGGPQATFMWEDCGQRVGTITHGEFVVTGAAPTVTIVNGIKITAAFGGGNFAVGDKWYIDAEAAKIFFLRKDDREVSLTVSTHTNPGVFQGACTGTYVTNTYEGGWGSWSASFDPNGVTPAYGMCALPDGLYYWFRNMSDFDAATNNRHDTGDQWDSNIVNDDLIHWDLEMEDTVSYDSDEVPVDQTGDITGIPATYYAILPYLPTSFVSVYDPVTLGAIGYVQVPGQPYIYFAAEPTNGVVIVYRTRGLEPDPGQIYYVTGTYLRPASMYNTPYYYSSRTASRRSLDPPSLDNDAYIASEIAWDCDPTGIYVSQVKDTDDDGMFTNTDYKTAIEACEAPTLIRDVVVVNHFSSLTDSLIHINKMNDPFKRRERILHVGAPIGTDIGDTLTPDTLVYLAKKTLQVYGEVPYHGTRVLVGSTEAKRDIQMLDGSTQEADLDGSFIAVAIAAMLSGFNMPYETILRKQLPGFSWAETYGDIDHPDNAILGANDIIYFTDQGSGVYRIEEDVTVDTYSDDMHLLNKMTQKQFLTHYVRSELDLKLPGTIVDNPADGVAKIKGFLISCLETAVGLGYIGTYRDNVTGQPRTISSNDDVIVYQSTSDSSLWYFAYAFYTKDEIKRLYGLYVVDTNDFGTVRP